MRTILACTLMVATCCVTLADDKIDPAKLIGKWEPKAKKESLSIVREFFKDGKTKTTFTAPNVKEVVYEGTYRVEGDKVLVTGRAGNLKSTSTVTKLTDSELVIVGAKGSESTFVRVKDKK